MCITLATVITTTGHTSIVDSLIFPDFAVYHCPDRKRAWLYKTDEPDRRIVADKDMEEPPTQQQVNQWVVDYLNDLLNKELAKMTKKG